VNEGEWKTKIKDVISRIEPYLHHKTNETIPPSIIPNVTHNATMPPTNTTTNTTTAPSNHTHAPMTNTTSNSTTNSTSGAKNTSTVSTMINPRMLSQYGSEVIEKVGDYSISTLKNKHEKKLTDQNEALNFIQMFAVFSVFGIAFLAIGVAMHSHRSRQRANLYYQNIAQVPPDAEQLL